MWRTIAGWMALVGFVAVGLAALKAASETWAAVLAAVAVALLVGAVFGAAFRTGPRRAFWAGFALVGWGYAFVCLFPGVSWHSERWLPTSAWLAWLHPRFCEPRLHSAPLRRDQFDESFSAWSEGYPLAQNVRIDLSDSEITVFWETPTLEPFLRTGHALFTLILAVLGGLIAGGIVRRWRVDSPGAPRDDP